MPKVVDSRALGPLAQSVEQRAFNSKRSPTNSTLQSRNPAFTGLSKIEGLEPPRCPGVYAIAGVAGYVKIGRAQNIADRLESLQPGHPVRLRLLAVLSFDPERERALHARWARLRAHGEWFAEDAELCEFVLERREFPEPVPSVDAPIPVARFDVFRAADAYRVCRRVLNDTYGIPRACDIAVVTDHLLENYDRQTRRPRSWGLDVVYEAGAPHVKLERQLAEAYARSTVRTKHRPRTLSNKRQP